MESKEAPSAAAEEEQGKEEIVDAAYAVPKQLGILRVLPCIENEQGGGKY